MSEGINHHRRRLFGAAAMTVAAAQLGMIGSARAQSGKTKPADLPTIKVQQMTPAAAQLPNRMARGQVLQCNIIPVLNLHGLS